jgi:hypothetical protein
MNKRVFPAILLSLLFTVVGIVCGWYGAVRTGAAADVAPGEDAAAAGQAEDNPALSPETLKNMGVVITPAKLENFSRYHPVPAVVSPLPSLVQGVYAPAAGRVKEVSKAFGSVVEKGEVLVTLVRDPLPWASLVLTGEVLKPLSETLHQSMADYRRAAIGVELVRAELKRLEKYTNGDDEIPLLPQKEFIKLTYDLARSEQELSIVENELLHHGLSREQVKEVEEGRLPPVDVEMWIGALRRNGFWTSPAQELYETLPEGLRSCTWTVATIGELVASDLLNPSLVSWLGGDAREVSYFLEIGGLLQRGHNLDDVKELCALGALDPVVKIAAPATAADWDLMDVHVKPGQRVTAGEIVVTLENARCLYLRTEPSGGEVALITDALQSGAALVAVPLIPDAAPRLEGLSLLKVFHEEENGGAVGYVPVDNLPLFVREDGAGSRFRTWSLREGQKYELRVPVDVFTNEFVFPSDAVVDDGPDRVVFRQNGDAFDRIPVEIRYQDHEFVVVRATADIFPGNPIVTQGAFALSLALRARGDIGAGGTGHGPDCGHSH